MGQPRSPTVDAPPTWWEASDDARAEVVNGCGPGSWRHDVVPDSLIGVSIGEACDIHDWMYEQGSTLDEKRWADTMFLRNMRALIDQSGGFWLLRWLRHRLAERYFAVVVALGGPAFEGDADEQP